MTYTILVYGATGYSGRLIAAEGARLGMRDGAHGYRMVLAGRNGAALGQLAAEHQMDFRAFGLEDERNVIRALTGVDVVINAATPFAFTADHLAKVALLVGCGYIDINGQMDVYTKLEDLGRHAESRGIAMVCSVGHTAAASELLLDVALHHLPASFSPPDPEKKELGAVRIAMSRILNLSRGSVETIVNSVREQVTVVRLRETDDGQGRTRKSDVLWHEPVGKLERTFDFGHDERKGAEPPRLSGTEEEPPQERIASAANLVDTLTARLTLKREQFIAHTIESYVELGRLGRIAYQSGTFFAPFAAMPWVRNLTHLQVELLPAGPTEKEREAERHTVVLEIEDPCQAPLIIWRWHTTNPYDFAARVVVKVAQRVARHSTLIGWLTPSQVLQPELYHLTSETGYLRGCQLEQAIVRERA
jgi:short subunit dehydrogenase-like uncharacterized protein